MGLEQGGGERMVLVLTKACRIDEWEMVVLIMETEWLGEEWACLLKCVVETWKWSSGD